MRSVPFMVPSVYSVPAVKNKSDYTALKHAAISRREACQAGVSPAKTPSTTESDTPHTHT